MNYWKLTTANTLN